MATIKVTKENFNQVIKSDRPVLLDFWAPWCGPCRMLGPVVEGIAEEYADQYVVGKINVDEQPELASQYGVMSIPTLAVFKNGRLAGTSVGVRPKQAILKLLEDNMLGLFEKKFTSLSMPEAQRTMKADTSITLIDVRTPEEYSSGHIPGSLSLPLDRADEIVNLVADKSARIFVYCLSGARSRAACRAFAAEGYKNVTDIGGIASYSGALAR